MTYKQRILTAKGEMESAYADYCVKPCNRFKENWQFAVEYYYDVLMNFGSKKQQEQARLKWEEEKQHIYC